MRRFQFRLQTLLEVRKRREEQAQMRLGQMEQALENLNQEKTQIEKTLGLQLQRLRFQQDEVLTSERLLQDRRKLDILQKQFQAKTVQVQEFSLQVEEQREKLVELSRAREVTEKIREKHFEQWQKENEREEQGTLDEIGSIAFTRRKRESGGVRTYVLLLLMLILMGALVYISGTQEGRQWIEDLSRKLVFQVTALEPVGEEGEGEGEGDGEVVAATEEMQIEEEQPQPVTIESVERERQRLAEWEEELERAKRRNRLELMALAELKEEIADMQADIDEKVARMEEYKKQQEQQMDEEKSKRLDNLAKIYSDSRSKVAAELLLQEDPETVVELFTRISQRNLVKIIADMNKIDPDRTQELLGLYSEQSMNPISF